MLQELIPASKFPLLNPCIHKWDLTYTVYNWKTYKCKSFIELTPGQTFKPTTLNISLSLRILDFSSCAKGSVTMLDPIAQRFRHCLGHSHGLLTKSYWLYSSDVALQVPTLLGVVASVCTPVPTRTQQLPTLLAQQCWELLRPFACSFSVSVACTQTLFYFSFRSFGKHRRAREGSERTRTSTERVKEK